MYMAYDWFLDDNPDVQERVTKGELRGLQKSALKIIRQRFPSLVKQVQQPIALINDLDELDQLIDQLLVVPDETGVRKLLKLPVDTLEAQ